MLVGLLEKRYCDIHDPNCFENIPLPPLAIVIAIVVVLFIACVYYATHQPKFGTKAWEQLEAIREDRKHTSLIDRGSTLYLFPNRHYLSKRSKSSSNKKSRFDYPGTLPPVTATIEEWEKAQAEYSEWLKTVPCKPIR